MTKEKQLERVSLPTEKLQQALPQVICLPTRSRMFAACAYLSVLVCLRVCTFLHVVECFEEHTMCPFVPASLQRVSLCCHKKPHSLSVARAFPHASLTETINQHPDVI